ncbi:MAG: hypothetical protein IPL49_00070 [Saprospirales bacterium]|nr:hypothetical protein [Saprospirales bacterium]
MWRESAESGCHSRERSVVSVQPAWVAGSVLEAKPIPVRSSSTGKEKGKVNPVKRAVWLFGEPPYTRPVQPDRYVSADTIVRGLGWAVWLTSPYSILGFIVFELL